MAEKEFHSEASQPPSEVSEGIESSGNISVDEASDETLLALYYSGDIYVQMCWWLFYILLILCTAVWISWRLFGEEISEILLMQGYNPSEKSQQQEEKDG
ncbi:hypothetical protein HOLleu_05254 [Holothuria leucospilota]|uniref:Uncharacterized protein n=1 Tax=Holothuria leucospilota TaxID=206669 RepID=A0A9Q1CKD9_HOLLE|nr:hypothetical protein HOLleu_05254 [Holothuria leucospilota]